MQTCVVEYQNVLGKYMILNATFEAFTTVKMEFMVFWDVSPFSVVVTYKRFGGPCCFHLQGSSGTVLRNIGIQPQYYTV